MIIIGHDYIKKCTKENNPIVQKKKKKPKGNINVRVEKEQHNIQSH